MSMKFVRSSEAFSTVLPFTEIRLYTRMPPTMLSVTNSFAIQTDGRTDRHLMKTQPAANMDDDDTAQ